MAGSSDAVVSSVLVIIPVASRDAKRSFMLRFVGSAPAENHDFILSTTTSSSLFFSSKQKIKVKL